MRHNRTPLESLKPNPIRATPITPFQMAAARNQLQTSTVRPGTLEKCLRLFVTRTIR